MKTQHFLYVAIVFIAFLSACTENKKQKTTVLPNVKTSYFGQKPPGLTPEIFAPGVISINGRYEHGISFSPNFDEVYFSANKEEEDPSIYFSFCEICFFRICPFFTFQFRKINTRIFFFFIG